MNFYDWETGGCVRRVDVVAQHVYWSESDLVVISSEDSFYVLKFVRAAYNQVVERNGPNSISEEGVEESFEFITEISEQYLSINIALKPDFGLEIVLFTRTEETD